jgi:hypothetical protein
MVQVKNALENNERDEKPSYDSALTGSAAVVADNVSEPAGDFSSMSEIAS